MRMFMLTDGDETVGEGIEFSDGTVTVRWTTKDASSHFADVDTLRSVVPHMEMGPVQTEPLSARLRAKRKLEGLSQRALAKNLGISFSTISRIEAGRNYVANPVLEKWVVEG